MRVLFEQEILKENDLQAAENKATFGKTLVINIIGSPGCGKTTLLERTLDALSPKYKMAVIEGDIYTAKDADRIQRHGVPVIQCNTAGGCHLSADIIARSSQELFYTLADGDASTSQDPTGNTLAEAANLDVLFIENVGNLVCPAEFNLGEDHKVAVLSIVEGDDKPAKYPLLFQEASIVLLNKCDFLQLTNFNMESALTDIHGLNPSAPILQLAAYPGTGLKPWIQWIEDEIKKKRNREKNKDM